MIRLLLAVALLMTTTPATAQSVFAEYNFADDKQAKAFKDLTAELRCLVCQNQNIADSNAPLAQDLRREIHEMLNDGDSKQDVIDFMVKRYGEFVLYKPVISTKTLLLWFGPALFFVVGILIIWNMAKRSKQAVAVEPDRQSLAEARQLLDDPKVSDQ